MSRAVIDRATREHVAAELDVSIALEASAGAGKTSVLVDRIVSSLQRGLDPARIAAITFTEKAAGELAERVLDRLDQVIQTVDTDVRAELDRALIRLPDLTTSTIHAFALDLLQREAFAAGWSPRTEVLAETLAASAVDEAYDAWRTAFDLRHPQLAVEIRQHAAESTIKAAAIELLRNRDLKPVIAASDIDWKGLRGDLDDLIRALAQTALLCKRPALCKLIENNAELLAVLPKLRELEHEPAVRAAIETSDNKSGGKSADWKQNGHLAFKDRIDDLRTWRTRASGAILARLHRVLISDLVEHFLPSVHARKQERGQADYDDLLFQCREMLRSNVAARARLAARFDAILVDEVQDTDPIQAEIVTYLTRAPELDGDWRAHPPLPGRLFAVGDPKQSIYRFRRADIATWREISALVAQGGEQQRLQQNFRSVPGIVAFANHVFAGLPNYQPIAPYREGAELDPVVVLRSNQDEETDAAARYLHRLLTAGARVIDRNTGQPRPIERRDVMILLPAWTHAEATQEKLLESGIDCIVEGGATFFDRDEVRLALAAIRALDEPTDAEAIVFLLRGLFGLSHDHLAKHIAAGGSWNYTAPEQPQGPVADSLAELRARYRERSRRTLNALIDELLEHTRAPAVWSLTPRGRAMLANLDKVREMIRQFEAVTHSPSEVIDRFDALRAAETEQDLPVADSDSDAVKITTLFKAKGLEAPVVIILHARRRQETPQAIVDREASEVAIKAKDLRPPDFDARQQAELHAQQDEMRRWMYVAATRARDQLVICHTDSSVLLSHDLMNGLAGIETAEHDSTKEIAPGVTIRIFDPGRLASPPARTETFPGLDQHIDALLATPPVEVDHEAVAREASCVAAIDRAELASIRWQSVSQAVKPVRGTYSGGVGALGGTVVHRVMEQLDLAKSRDELLAEAGALVEAHSVLAGLDTKRAKACEAVVRGLIEHPIVDRARIAPERWQEVSFAYEETDGRIITGTIDLCFPLATDRKEWVVVDWKSSLPPEGTPERTAYEKQLELYARALIATLVGHPIQVVDRVLAGPHPSLLPDPWEVVLEEVREELGGGLSMLRELGVPPPEVGAELDGIELELLWLERGIALAIDLAESELEIIGRSSLEVVAVRTRDPVWDRSALRDLADIFRCTINDTITE